MFSPAAVKIIRADDIEQNNERMVETRRARTPAQVLGEYRRWSRVFGATIPLAVSGSIGGVRLPVGELGRFPVRVLPSALVFDHHTHLAHDMAPALGRSVPALDSNRMAAVLEWMTAVLANQLSASKPVWLDRPLSITLAGPGGGSWRIETSGAVSPGPTEPAAANVISIAMEFPEWGTKRADWRERDVTIAGDVDYGTTFLDAVNIV